MLLDLKSKYIPLFESDSRYYVITGGRGSGKSFSINVFLLLLTYELNQTILFTRYTLTSAEVSIIPEFIEKIEMLDRQADFEITKKEIVNKTTGSKILFKGIKTGAGNQTANLKSLAGVTCWVLDEAEELTDENVLDKIDFSIRLKGIQNRVILILNPTTKEHFIYQRFFESVGWDAGVNGTKNDTTYIHTTYLDNIENLDKSFLNQVERLKTTNENKYKHTILGGWLEKAEGVIFTNWRIGNFETHSTPIYGQDYGYSIDPTTLVKTSIDFKNKRIFVEELLHKPNLTTTDIMQLNKSLTNGGLIYGDSAESRLIAELQMAGCNILPVKKTEVTFGISVLQDYELIITENSTNLIKELNNYHWLDNKKATPCDMHNHCFTADTMVTTINGQVPINEVQVNDLVLTSEGYKRVLKTFDNGVKEVNEYSMQFDTFSVSLCSTKEHKIKTKNGWKKISQLQEMDTLYKYKCLTENNSNYIREKDTLVEVQRDCIERFGNSIRGKYQKATIFTTLMEIPRIIAYQILIWYTGLCIVGSRVKKGLKRILSSLKSFTQKVLSQRKNGTSLKMVENGIVNTENKRGSIGNNQRKNVLFVRKNTKHHSQVEVNTAIKTAKLKHFAKGESYKARVYDLMVEDCHEYFANGILVHNCVDALRYATVGQIVIKESKYYVY